MAAMAMLALALVNFRRPDTNEKVKLSGTDLMIALDVSNSMMARDIQPNRLEKAKLLISKIIDQLEGNRLGLVVFAGNAYLQMPLTTDASAAKLFLSTISPDLVPLQGTNIGDALNLCNRSLSSQDKKYKSILLISDGEDQEEAALTTAKELREKGVVINTVGVGSPGGSPIADPATNDNKRDDQGNVVITKLNEPALKEIAAETNGSYQLLNEADDAANKIIEQLRGMEKKPLTDSTLTNYASFFWVFVVMAMLLLVVEILISEKKRTLNKRQQPAQAKGFFHSSANEILSKTAIVLMLSCLSFSKAFTQKENELVRKGNEAYKQQKFDEAGKQYEAVLKQNNSNTTATFNLGNTQYKSGKYEEADKQYEALATGKTDRPLQAKSLYNKGVSLIKQKKIEEAINAFKQSLKAYPNDEETRENLQKAMNELRQQQQQKKKDDKQDDKKKDDKKDDQKDKKEQDKQDEKEQKKPQPKPKISKENAEQKLQALRQEEKKLQQKLSQKQRSNTKQPEKDW